MTKVKVLDVVTMHGLMLAALQLFEGEVTLGLILVGAEGQWKVSGISTVSVDAWRSGRRGVSLQPLGESPAPTVGAELAEANLRKTT